MQVVCALKELAKGGHTVIAVMHQVLSLRALLVQKVLRLLALLVQKYKYRHLRSCVKALTSAAVFSMFHDLLLSFLLNLLALLVQKYKY